MITLALIFAAISIWAIFGAASIGIWIISTILSIVFGIVWFVLKTTVHVALRLFGLVIIFGIVAVGVMYVLPMI